MLRKTFIIVSLFPALLALSGCGKEKYTDFRVYPIPDSLTLERGSKSFIAFRVEMPGKHHIYGNPKGPGTGKATDIIVAKNDNFTFGVPQFLPATKYNATGEKEFVWTYKDETTIFVPVTAGKNARNGLHKLDITFDALLCSTTTCIPKQIRLIYPVTVTDPGLGSTMQSSSLTALFAASSPPGENLQKEDAASSAKETGFILKGSTFEPRYIESSNITGLIQAIIFGLIAGFILNFMPCVLPVVSLKIMSFVKHAGESRRELVKLGSLFSLGILTSFLALALLASFFGYGWGGLFQHRLFLIIMTGFVFVLALSMFEVFTISAPSISGKAAQVRDNRYSDAFIKGLLATLLATPCSGPFLGGTLAWALTRPPHIIFIIFMSVGVGMALPYFILTVRPPLLKLIPKPGEWMRTFENIMGFLLIFTAVYLISILDSSLHLPMAAFLAFLAAAFWQYGRFGALFQPRWKRIASTAALIAIITGGYFFSFTFLTAEEGTVQLSSSAFSEERILANRDSGRISMVKFTADWCPNCKFVEKVSLYTPAVEGAIRNSGIDFMIADITVKNAAAEALMEKLGSRSIPFLAILPPGADFSRPICLRDIYSEKDVLRAIDMAGKKEKTKGEAPGFIFKVQ